MDSLWTKRTFGGAGKRKTFIENLQGARYSARLFTNIIIFNVHGEYMR